MRNGQSVEEAINDFINRSVGELRKSAFGDDVEDARALPWSREQAWAVLKALAIHDEVRLYLSTSLCKSHRDALGIGAILRCAVEFPVQGRRDGTPEHGAGGIDIDQYTKWSVLLRTSLGNCMCKRSTIGRPTVIRPGKPVYRYVFEQLVGGASCSLRHHAQRVYRGCIDS